MVCICILFASKLKYSSKFRLFQDKNFSLSNNRKNLEQEIITGTVIKIRNYQSQKSHSNIADVGQFWD